MLGQDVLLTPISWSRRIHDGDGVHSGGEAELAVDDEDKVRLGQSRRIQITRPDVHRDKKKPARGLGTSSVAYNMVVQGKIIIISVRRIRFWGIMLCCTLSVIRS